jgi:hypothetical protein
VLCCEQERDSASAYAETKRLSRTLASAQPKASADWHVQYVAYASADAVAWAEARADAVDVAAADAHAQPLASPPLTDVDVQEVDAEAIAYACNLLPLQEECPQSLYILPRVALERDTVQGNNDKEEANGKRLTPF